MQFLSSVLKFSLLAFFLPVFSVSFSASYTSFGELSSQHKLGVEYDIIFEDHIVHPAFTFFAIHGGGIEKHTSPIVDRFVELSRMQFPTNFYLFEGILKTGNSQFHITSDLFDEPNAIRMASESEKCVSIHGFKAHIPQPIACIGGAEKSKPYLEKIASLLRSSPELSHWMIEYPCRKFPGHSPTNIINRCNSHGVQLELSLSAREELMKGIAIENAPLTAILKAIQE